MCLCPRAGSSYGSAVVLSSDGVIAVVGAHQTDGSGTSKDEGAAYVFKVG